MACVDSSWRLWCAERMCCAINVISNCNRRNNISMYKFTFQKALCSDHAARFLSVTGQQQQLKGGGGGGGRKRKWTQMRIINLIIALRFFLGAFYQSSRKSYHYMHGRYFERTWIYWFNRDKLESFRLRLLMAHPTKAYTVIYNKISFFCLFCKYCCFINYNAH